MRKCKIIDIKDNDKKLKLLWLSLGGPSQSLSSIWIIPIFCYQQLSYWSSLANHPLVLRILFTYVTFDCASGVWITWPKRTAFDKSSALLVKVSILSGEDLLSRLPHYSIQCSKQAHHKTHPLVQTRLWLIIIRLMVAIIAVLILTGSPLSGIYQV